MRATSGRKILVRRKTEATIDAPSSVRRASISLVEPRSVPVVVATPKVILATKLDHHAGFLLSLIDGVTDVESLIDVCGMSEDEAISALEGLVRVKLVKLHPGDARRRSLRPPRRPSQS